MIGTLNKIAARWQPAAVKIFRHDADLPPLVNPRHAPKVFYRLMAGRRLGIPSPPMKTIQLLTMAIAALMPGGCEKAELQPGELVGSSDGSATFRQDLEFLKAHTDIHVLQDGSGARVAVAPAWQGRVMTSSATGDEGPSLGWIHYDNVRTGILPPAEREGLARHIHVFGGEERFWLGPEGGQYALFFPPPPTPYTFENWFTPALIDTEPFEVAVGDDRSVEFRKDASLINRAGTDLRMGIVRIVELLDANMLATELGIAVPPGAAAVGYRTTNTLTNRGETAWTHEDGLVSIWLLGMFPHGPEVTMVIPLKDGPGNAVNADYFGTLGEDRLVTTDTAVFFKGDGEFRSKIGVPPGRSTGVAGSHDAQRGRLTIVRCEMPENAAGLPYVRSQWEDHDAPYAGDLINAYNDGPPSPEEAPLGPFYELETSSPALPLEPGQSMTHVQSTMHFQGDAKSLDSIAQAMLGVSLGEITAAFSNPSSE